MRKVYCVMGNSSCLAVSIRTTIDRAVLRVVKNCWSVRIDISLPLVESDRQYWTWMEVVLTWTKFQIGIQLKTEEPENHTLSCCATYRCRAKWGSAPQHLKRNGFKQIWIVTCKIKWLVFAEEEGWFKPRLLMPVAMNVSIHSTDTTLQSLLLQRTPSPGCRPLFACRMSCRALWLARPTMTPAESVLTPWPWLLVVRLSPSCTF